MTLADAFKLAHKVDGVSAAIFKCPLGETACANDGCKPGYTGPLCNTCAEGYSRSGLEGECTECSGAGVSWLVVVGGISGSVALTTGALFIATHGGTENSSFVALAKIAISMVQILCAMEATFKIVLPGVFGGFIRLLKVFALDLLGFLNIGCIAKFTYSQKLLFAFMLAPCLLAGVMIVYVYRKSELDATEVRTKMIFAALFLLYPFVSQTTFQAFACRDLGSASWLAVDYQVPCDDDGYTLLVLSSA